VNNLTSEDIHPAHTKLRKHVLPALKYDYAALAPYIDLRTMVVHHDNHHAGYVNKLNMDFPEYHRRLSVSIL
jgi:superoxide dismutase